MNTQMQLSLPFLLVVLVGFPHLPGHFHWGSKPFLPVVGLLEGHECRAVGDEIWHHHGLTQHLKPPRVGSFPDQPKHPKKTPPNWFFVPSPACPKDWSKKMSQKCVLPKIHWVFVPYRKLGEEISTISCWTWVIEARQAAVVAGPPA